MTDFIQDYVLPPQRPNRGNFTVQSALDEAINQASPEVNILSKDYTPNVRYDPNLIQSLQNQIKSRNNQTVNNSILNGIAQRHGTSLPAPEVMAQEVANNAPTDYSNMTQEQKIQALTELRQNPSTQTSDVFSYSPSFSETMFDNAIREAFPNLTEHGVETIRNTVDNNVRLQRELDRRYENLRNIQAENDSIVKSNRELQELGIPNLEQTKNITSVNPTLGVMNEYRFGNAPEPASSNNSSAGNIINETANNTNTESLNQNQNTTGSQNNAASNAINNTVQSAEQEKLNNQYSAILDLSDRKNQILKSNLSEEEKKAQIGELDAYEMDPNALEKSHQNMVQLIQSNAAEIQSQTAHSFDDIDALLTQADNSPYKVAEYLMEKRFGLTKADDKVAYSKLVKAIDDARRKADAKKIKASYGEIGMAIIANYDETNWGTDIENTDFSLSSKFLEYIQKAHNESQNDIHALQKMQSFLKDLDAYDEAYKAFKAEQNSLLTYRQGLGRQETKALQNLQDENTRLLTQQFNTVHSNYARRAKALFNTAYDLGSRRRKRDSQQQQ